MTIVHWLAHVAGLTNGSGSWYLLWSGIFGDVTIFAAGVAIYRKTNCHAHRCWRIGRHPVDGTPYVTCRHHHPTIDGKPTAGDIHRAHRAARGRFL